MAKYMDYLCENYPHISFKRNWDIKDSMFMLGECKAMIDAISFLPCSPEKMHKLLKVSLIKGAMATTAIEGNTLSEEEVADVYEGKKIEASREYLEKEVKNVIDALNTILNDVLIEDRDDYISVDLICSYHKMIGKGLGENFASIPGKIRENNVHVGTYRPPNYEYLPDIMQKFCLWLKEEFGYKQDQEQNFIDNIVESIVAHAYIAFIHPFGDGNGRTARMIEFYFLLRGCLPNICSHLLSNHYNNTRSEYYRQLENATKRRDLSDFIRYAVRGLRDGLALQLAALQRHQLEGAWKSYIYDVAENWRVAEKRRKRMSIMVSHMNIFDEYHLNDIASCHPDTVREYAKLTPTILTRDIDFLLEEKILIKKEKGYSVNIGVLLSNLPDRRTIRQK